MTNNWAADAFSLTSAATSYWGAAAVPSDPVDADHHVPLMLLQRIAEPEASPFAPCALLAAEDAGRQDRLDQAFASPGQPLDRTCDETSRMKGEVIAIRFRTAQRKN